MARKIVRRVRMEGGLVVNKVVNINKNLPFTRTEIVKTDYNKPVEAPVPVVNPKGKKSVVAVTPPVPERPSQSGKNQSVTEIPIKVITFDESKSKATRAQVLKAINEALIGKPKKLGQRGGFLKRLE